MDEEIDARRDEPLLQSEASHEGDGAAPEQLGDFVLQQQQQQQAQAQEGMGQTAAFTRAYVAKLNRWRRAVFAFWGVLFLAGGYFAPKFMEVVLLVFEPPPGTPGNEAQQKMEHFFPGMSREWDAIILLNTRDKAPILGDSYANVTERFIDKLSASVVRYGHEKAEPETDFAVAHYFLLQKVMAQTTANSLLDRSDDPPRATAMLVSVHKNSGFEQGSMEGNRFADWLDTEMEHIRHDVGLPHNVEVRATGMMSFCRDMQEGSEKDMLKMDSLSFPFALLLLAYMLRSFRLLLIPMINITIGLVVSFMLMYPVALSTRVIAVAPSVMMSVLVAFSIDYSLFLLTRFREEVLKGVKVYDAVILMIDSAGHTIMVSGATIAICWFGLLFFPVTLLSTIGLGAGLTVVIAFFVNISFTPVLLLSFPDFFTNFDSFGCGCAFRQSAPNDSTRAGSSSDLLERGRGGRNPGTEDLLRRGSSTHSVFESPCAIDAFGRRPILSPGAAEGATTSPMVRFSSTPRSGTVRTPTLNQDGTVRGEVTSELFGVVDPLEEVAFLAEHSSFYRCGDALFGTPRRALASVVIVCAAILPLTPYAIGFHHSESFKLFTPSDSVATQAALDLEDLYGGGRLAPYQLLIEPAAGTRVLSNSFFKHVTEVLENVILPLSYGASKPLALRREGISGMMMMSGHNIALLPFGDKPHDLTVVGCAVEGVEYAAYFCANTRCEAEMEACEADSACRDGADCLRESFGRPWDTARCLDRLQDINVASLSLAKCIVKRCALHPLSPNTSHVAAGSAILNDGAGVEGSVQALPALGTTNSTLPLPDCPSVLLQVFQSVRGLVPKATWLIMNLEIDPFSKDGTEWLDAVRIALKDQSAADGYRYFLTGGAVAGHDVVNKVFELYPLILGIIIGVVFLLMGFSYRSLMVPLRAVFTILITLILVYGMGVLTYEHGMLEWTHFSAFINPVHDALSWLVPAMIAPVAIGLSLDYDIFLLTRIFEYRHAGFNTKDSIMCGLAQTGPVITCAGCIMFFAFFGLSLSSNAALNQMSFFLCVSVISDTFIIRTILVPSLMILFKEGNWWPSVPATLEY